MRAYEQVLEAVSTKLSFGYETIRVYKGAELKSAQVGYSVSSNGESLIGSAEGDWLKNWLVIGYEELCGDPLFIDTASDGFPVYTAVHGEGRWDAKPVAISLEAFSKSLSAVAQVAQGRESPVALEGNPLMETERAATLAAIRLHNPGMDLEFWENVLS